MDITTFLASLWGPTILAVALGVFTNRTFYIKIYRDLEKSSLTVLVFGMMAMAAGIAQITFHNAWETLPQMVVSFLGWGLLIKGALFLVAPSFVDKAGDAWAKKKLIPVAGILMLVVGAYLTWFAFVAN
ncbi:MAG TPA: hypothetical protein PK609_01585 [Candidatus Paceibacterota bacterium]|nr:hypothetical protein [Candidatus Paceibacterota bacterium]